MLVTITLLSLIVTMSIPGLKSFFSRMEVSNALRTVTCAFSAARYESVRKNRRVKVSMKGEKFFLMEKKGGYWKEFRSFQLDKAVSVSMNASPVFSPYGSVAPLCSVYVENVNYRYKITISMAGRIKVSQLE
jgi:hypothetical protein